MSVNVKNLCFSYGERQVLKNISFEADGGALISVLGPNGVGKSTLFRCILGLLKGYTGSIEIDGVDASKLTAKELAHRVAYIPQNHYPSFNYPAFDMVLMGTTHGLSAARSPGKKERLKAAAAMERMGISYLRDRGYARLSGGEQQMVLIARALAQDTKTLVMDEPTSALDYGNQLRVMERVSELSKDGYCVMLSSHSPQTALSFSDKVLAMYGGEVCALGEPEKVMDEALMDKLYGVKVRFAEIDGGRFIIPENRKGV